MPSPSIFSCRLAAVALPLLLATTGARAQAFSITQPNITTCTGAFLDSGGEGASGYSNNETYVSTICSDQPGHAISLNWVTFNLSTEGDAPIDQITIYDGADLSAPVIGTWTGHNSPGIISASFGNTSGCLTVQFTSNATGTGVFAATISCYIPCEPPLASAVMSVPSTAWICQGETVDLNGTASTAAQDRTITRYTWDFDDGSMDSTSGPQVSHTFQEPGEYVVQLLLTDDIGCHNTNRVDQRVWVSTTPHFDLPPDQEICLGASVDLTGSATPTTWTALPHADFGDGVPLPDNVGETFSSPITFSAFEPGATLTDIDQLFSVCVDMEHTFMGDLVIQLVCPNGQSVIFHEQGGSGTFLGDANDADDVDPVAGTCWHYCWSPTATNGTWVDNSSVGSDPHLTMASQGESLTPDTYESLYPMSQLVGCPLNGTWTFQITDLWAADNGFLCAWEMAFDPSLYPDLTEYTPTLGMSTADSSWWTGPSFVVDPNNHLNGTVTPTSVGTFDYVFHVTDNFGCTYTDTTTVTVNPSPQGPPVIQGDPSICTGEYSTLSTTLNYDVYDWSDGTHNATTTVGPGSYTVTVGAGSCTFTSDPFVVTQSPSPQPEITGVLFNCSGDPAVLSTTQPYSSYLWSNSSTAASISVGTGTWSVTVTDANGCTGTDQVDVASAEAPTAAFTVAPASPQQPGVTATFNDGSLANGSTIVGWHWTFGGEVPDSHEQDPVITFDEPGQYAVQLVVTNVEGCTDTVVSYYVVAPGDIVVPNIFSPNGDGENDYLMFSNAQYYPNTQLQVYNRWGKLIYENGNYRNTWSAQGVSEGTYFFLLRLQDGREWHGAVTLVR